MKEEQKITDYRKLNRIQISFSLHKKIKARYFKTITILRIRNLQNSISSRGKKLNLKIDSSIHRLAVKWLESKSSRLISPSFLPQRSPKSLSFTLDVRHWPLLDAWPTRTGITFIHDFSLDSPIFLQGLQSLLDTEWSPRCVTFLPIDLEKTRFRCGPLRPLFAGIFVLSGRILDGATFQIRVYCWDRGV